VSDGVPQVTGPVAQPAEVFNYLIIWVQPEPEQASPTRSTKDRQLAGLRRHSVDIYRIYIGRFFDQLGPRAACAKVASVEDQTNST